MLSRVSNWDTSLCKLSDQIHMYIPQKAQSKYENQCNQSLEVENLHQQLPDNLKQPCMHEGCIKLALWMSFRRIGIYLHDGAFWDDISYGWHLSYLPYLWKIIYSRTSFKLQSRQDFSFTPKQQNERNCWAEVCS